MKTYLAVPFEQKAHARELGSQWDPARKAWYVPDGIDLTLFLEWVPHLPKLSESVRRALRRRT